MKYIIALFLTLTIGNALAQDNVVFRNDGKMYVASKSNASSTVVHIGGGFQAKKASDIILNGKIDLMGNFINDIESGHVFGTQSTGIFEFNGEKTQRIEGTANKGNNYIQFPKLIINNQTPIYDPLSEVTTVTLSPTMGVTTKDLHLERGRFILDSDISEGKTRIGHLLVNGEVSVPTDNLYRIAYDKGLMQVNYKLGNGTIKDKVFGITPPFKKIYADYFLYNLVSRPTNKGLFGDNPRLFRKPTDYLLSGNGYLTGIGVVPLEVYQNNQSSVWRDADPNERISDMISFVRDFAPHSLMQFVNYDPTITDQYSQEVIQTKGVSVTVEKGWNYIGNPYTVPIDMKEFLEQTGSVSDWGISLSANFEPSYHVFTEGTGTYKVIGENIDDPVSYTFNLTFEEVNAIGGTGNQKTTLVGPMQMIKIYKTTDGTATLTIPAKIRTHGDMVPTKSDKDFFVERNELLLEAKESNTGFYDRLTIVMRDESEFPSIRKNNASKHIEESHLGVQIYTMSSDKKMLTANIIPTSTKELKLYLKPAGEKRQVTLTADRLESFSGMQDLSLVDHQTGIKTDLLNTPTYTFTSSPTDSEERFTLYFSNTPTANENLLQSEINIRYQEGWIMVKGLESQNIGNRLSIYDISGRVVGQYEVTHTPEQQFPITLGKGIYILKLAGTEAISKKIIVQ